MEFADTIRGNSMSAPGNHFVINGEGSRADVQMLSLECLKQLARAKESGRQ